MATPAASAAATEALGRRILSEIEEASLEEVLQRVRARLRVLPSPSTAAPSYHPDTAVTTGTAAAATNTTVAATTSTTTTVVHPAIPLFPIPALQSLVARHFHATRAPELTVGGPHALPFLYLLTAVLVTAPRRQAVIIVDLEARFRVEALRGMHVVVGTTTTPKMTTTTTSHPVSDSDLLHVHVVPASLDVRRDSLAAVVAAAEQRVLYETHRKRDRDCWGTLVVGGAGLGLVTANNNKNSHTLGNTVATGYYGWLRVAPATSESNPQEEEEEDRRQKRLAALYEAAQSGNMDQVRRLAREQEDPESPPKPVTWVASSDWGSFTFQLIRDETK